MQAGNWIGIAAAVVVVAYLAWMVVARRNKR